MGLLLLPPPKGGDGDSENEKRWRGGELYRPDVEIGFKYWGQTGEDDRMDPPGGVGQER